jgi:hypothetical protein
MTRACGLGFRRSVRTACGTPRRLGCCVRARRCRRSRRCCATARSRPRRSMRNAPRGALLYPRRSREELEGRFLGPMTYPDPKGERNNSMSGKRRSSSGVRGDASRDPCDMAKAGLPEAQSPEDAKIRPPERHLLPAPCFATASFAGCRNLRSVERCPARAIKEMSGTPKSRSDVQQRRTRDQPTGREPHGDGVPIVVVEVTIHQGGRESRPQGEGAQAMGYLMAGRYA